MAKGPNTKAKGWIVMLAFGWLWGCWFVGGHGLALGGVRVTEIAPTPTSRKPALPLVIYGTGARGIPFSPSGWMGNISAIHLNDQCAENPHSGAACIKLEYTAATGWAGIVWLDPPNDWGDRDGGYDLTGATKLTFWACGGAGGEKVEFYFGTIKSDKPFPDSDTGRIAVTLTREWKQYSIDLSGKNLARIKTGFGWSLAGQGKPVAFYLDDIQYE